MDRSLITKIAVLLVFLLAAGVFVSVSPEIRTLPDSSRIFVNSSDKTGAELFGRACVSCHGTDGRGQTPRGKRKGAADLTKSKINVRKGLKTITFGRGSMPSFKDTLSAAEVRLVNEYARSFRK